MDSFRKILEQKLQRTVEDIALSPSRKTTPSSPPVWESLRLEVQPPHPIRGFYPSQRKNPPLTPPKDLTPSQQQAFSFFAQRLSLNFLASPRILKKVYRRLALQYHPDRTKGDPSQFRQLQESFLALEEYLQQRSRAG